MASNYLMRDNAIGPEHEVYVTGGIEYFHHFLVAE
jgi:hypothetical protein